MRVQVDGRPDERIPRRGILRVPSEDPVLDDDPFGTPTPFR